MSTNGNSRKFLNRTGPDGGGRGQSRSNRPGCRLFGTVSKDRGASISSCHAPEAVRAAGANPIQLEQIRVTGLVQVRRSFFHHHGVRRRLYQGGSGGCYADGPVRHHRELSKPNFPPGLVWQWRNRWNPAAGDTSHSWTVRKMSKIRGSEISSVAANERDIHQTKKSANPANQSGLRSRRGHTLSVSG